MYCVSDACTVDKLVITLWLTYKKQIDRMKIISRLRSLTKQNYVLKHEKTRGIYSLTPQGKDTTKALDAKKD